MLPKFLTLTNENLSDELTNQIVDYINDYLADKYGYCNNGYTYDITIDLSNIDWDTED